MSEIKRNLKVVDDKVSLKEISEDTTGYLIQEVSYALMTRWFPNRLPTGEDYASWIKISLDDATAVVNHLVKKNLIEEAE